MCGGLRRRGRRTRTSSRPAASAAGPAPPSPTGDDFAGDAGGDQFGAELVRCFADDIVALFDDVHAALDAAFETHRRIRIFNESPLATEYPTQCCAGIGYGRVFAIGPNLAQGDEMNRASKLGEDIARSNETLVTERAYAALSSREDLHFDAQDQDDQLFPFYRVTPRS